GHRVRPQEPHVRPARDPRGRDRRWLAQVPRVARAAGRRTPQIGEIQPLIEHLDWIGVATAIDDRGARRSGGKRRQRKRAAVAAEAEAPKQETAISSGTAELEALATAVARMAAAPEPAALPVQDGNGHQPELGPAVLVPETPAPPVEEFTDLLGQAVGLRLDSVSREF